MDIEMILSPFSHSISFSSRISISCIVRARNYVSAEPGILAVKSLTKDPKFPLATAA